MKDFKNYGEHLQYEQKKERIIGSILIIFLVFMAWVSSEMH